MSACGTTRTCSRPRRRTQCWATTRPCSRRCQRPRQKISAVRCCPKAERRQLLVSGTRRGRTTRGCARTSCSKHRWSAPGRVAVVEGDRQLSYRELNRRANRVAHRLRALGVGRAAGGDLRRTLGGVGGSDCWATQGGWSVRSVGYPRYPAQRLEYMLQDSGARVLLTRTPLVSRLHGGRRPVLLTIFASKAEMMTARQTSAPRCRPRIWPT